MNKTSNVGFTICLHHATKLHQTKVICPPKGAVVTWSSGSRSQCTITAEPTVSVGQRNHDRMRHLNKVLHSRSSQVPLHWSTY